MNESIYYNVDILHDAINRGRQIRFHYYRWNVRKRMEFRKDGAWYQVSPWCLMWVNENYYLVAFDAEEEKIKHYRVDKMVNLSVVDLPREGREEFCQFDATQYSRRLFGMFGGEKTKVTLEFKNSYVGVLLDRFGKEITIRPSKTEGWSQTNVDVAMSDQFLGWIFALGSGVKIVKPENVVKKFISELNSMKKLYR